MAGHSHWAGIKHKKAATDAAKGKIFSKHSAMITMEVKKANGDANAANVIAAVDRAKRDSMPKDNIERAIAKGGVHPPSQGAKSVDVRTRSDLKTSDAITEDIGRRGRYGNEQGFEEDPEPE